MFKFSILRLMGLVLLVAIGLAAAMAGAFTFAVVTLSATTLGTLLSRGSRRAFFLGCTVVGTVAMLGFFLAGPDVRNALPTTRLIVRIYEAINGPGPTAFKSEEEAIEWLSRMVQALNRAITAGHSLISLALALAGGAILWLIANLRRDRTAPNEGPSPSVAPPA